jgi:NtrC-family two-component system response regulator AlgB
LRNAIERAVILSKHEQIGADDLPLNNTNPGVENAEATPQPGDLISLEKLEQFHIRKVLERTPSIAEAARVLGIDQATIYRKRKKMDLEPSRELHLV